MSTSPAVRFSVCSSENHFRAAETVTSIETTYSDRPAELIVQVFLLLLLLVFSPLS